ncbi:hypothetical protein NC652_040184 [Populus alba x Populus x berolinensis]|nr:hypothetical protein NC652_040184 [Populus alba x Populus x berolinensis]
MFVVLLELCGEADIVRQLKESYSVPLTTSIACNRCSHFHLEDHYKGITPLEPSTSPNKCSLLLYS